MKNRKKALVVEIILYVVSGGLALWGLTYMILGLLAKYLPILSSKNPLVSFDNTIANLFGLNSLYWGMIIFVIGALVAVLTLLYFAKSADRDFDKKERRKARLLHIEENINKTVETTEENQ